MLVQHPLQRIPRILQEMPAIGDLACLRRALCRPFSIGPGPITTNNDDLGMVTEPGGERRRLAIGQDIDRAMPLQVDDQGAVALAFAEGKIVDADDRRWWWRWEVRTPLEAKQGGGTRGHAEVVDDGGPGF